MGQLSQSISVFCPAKVNLFLAITGQRDDGFHDLISLVAKCQWGDQLRVTYDWNAEADHLKIVGSDLTPEGNTILRTASLLRDSFSFQGAFRFELEKRIPHGAGLGGGSSDGVEALKAMVGLLDLEVNDAEMHGLASKIGSDCPLFLSSGPVIMRGRGEIVNPLSGQASALLAEKKILIIKPPFSISTPRAYQRLAARNYYSGAAEADAVLAKWMGGHGGIEVPVHNDFESLLSEWMPSLWIVLTKLRTELGLSCGMSGSGSALYILTQENDGELRAIKDILESAWGKEYFWIHTSLQ